MTTPPSTLTRANRAAALLRQVSEPRRLQILLILAGGEAHVGTLQAELGNAKQSLVSTHLSRLLLGGLVESERRGRNNYYRITDRGRALVEAADGLEGLR